MKYNHVHFFFIEVCPYKKSNMYVTYKNENNISSISLLKKIINSSTSFLFWLQLLQNVIG